MLTGIWHGANYTFILWGMIYFALQLVERYIFKGIEKLHIVGHLYTMIVVTILWTLFRSEDVSSFIKMFKSLLGLNGALDINSIAYLKNSIVLMVIGILGSTPIVRLMHERIIMSRVSICKGVFLALKYACLILILILVTFKSISGGYSPFIYFNF